MILFRFWAHIKVVPCRPTRTPRRSPWLSKLHCTSFSTSPHLRIKSGTASFLPSPTASSLPEPSSKSILKPGGPMNWVGTGPDGKRTTYVRGEVLQSEPPKLLQYTFALGSSSKTSRVTIELMRETEATRVSVTHDQWTEDDTAYTSSVDGWPRILSRLKTSVETGKTFKPH